MVLRGRCSLPRVSSKVSHRSVGTESAVEEKTPWLSMPLPLHDEWHDGGESDVEEKQNVSDCSAAQPCKNS